MSPFLTPVCTVPPRVSEAVGRCRAVVLRRPSSFIAPAAAAGPLFEEIPPSASGIAWMHDNAMSVSRYLPETMGPGVAFFDYDNDGWMDVFLVNSGSSDFYTPPRR